MGVVDVEAHGAEQVLHPGVVGIHSIDQVLVPTPDDHLSAGGNRRKVTVSGWATTSQMPMWLLNNLSGDRDFIVGFKTQRAFAFVGVIKGDGHGGLRDPSLSVFVNQILKVRGSHLRAQPTRTGRRRQLLSRWVDTHTYIYITHLRG